jgi:hypothetical protein
MSRFSTLRPAFKSCENYGVVKHRTKRNKRRWCDTLHLSPFVHFFALKNSQTIVFGSTPNGTGFCLITISLENEERNNRMRIARKTCVALPSLKRISLGLSLLHQFLLFLQANRNEKNEERTTKISTSNRRRAKKELSKHSDGRLQHRNATTTTCACVHMSVLFLSSALLVSSVRRGFSPSRPSSLARYTAAPSCSCSCSSCQTSCPRPPWLSPLQPPTKSKNRTQNDAVRKQRINSTTPTVPIERANDKKKYAISKTSLLSSLRHSLAALQIMY